MTARVRGVPRRASGRKVSAGSEIDRRSRIAGGGGPDGFAGGAGVLPRGIEPEVDPAGFARPAVR